MFKKLFLILAIIGLLASPTQAAWVETLPADTATVAAGTTATRANFAAIDTVIGTQLDTGTEITATATELNALDGIISTVTELNYTDGVTSAIQTQIDSKEGTLTNSAGLLGALSDETGTGVAVFGTSPTIATPTFTTSITIGSAGISEAELEILDGATLSTAELNILDGATATYTELNYVDGVTSAIQTQIDTKLSSVSQGDLNTTTGEVSGDGNLTLPGGTYGFYPQVKATDVAQNWIWTIASGSTTTSYVTRIHHNNAACYSQQRYITASGHDHWIFLKIDKITKEIISGYQAPDHPSANQGGATELDIPHPFGSYDPTKHEIIVVDNAELSEMLARKTRKKSLLTVINEDYIIDDTKKPKWTPREIVKIDEYGDLPGEVIKTMKTPGWAKLMIGAEEITLKRQMVDKLPDNIKFRKMKLKGSQ